MIYPRSLENNLLSSKYHIEKHGFDLIIKDGFKGKRILEVACGTGFYSKWLAENYPDCEVTGVDFAIDKIETANSNCSGITNLNFYAGDISTALPNNYEYFDLIFVRSALHHMTNNLEGVSTVMYSMLKPNCKCIFIREPLGHNAIWAAVRAMMNSRKQLTDESNLYIKNITQFSIPFNKYIIYPFDLLSYMLKILPASLITKYIASIFNWVDSLIFKYVPFLKKFGANANIVFIKKG